MMTRPRRLLWPPLLLAVVVALATTRAAAAADTDDAKQHVNTWALRLSPAALRDVAAAELARRHVADSPAAAAVAPALADIPDAVLIAVRDTLPSRSRRSEEDSDLDGFDVPVSAAAAAAWWESASMAPLWDAAAATVAARHGLVSLGRVAALSDTFVFAPADSETAVHGRHVRHGRDSERTERLAAGEHVEWAEQQRVLARSRRSIDQRARIVDVEAPSFPDPMFSQQWHLVNQARPGHDINVMDAWSHGFTGRGVVVSVLDDGLEYDHSDFIGNYDPEASYDFNDNDANPYPRYDPTDLNKHGTRCAGEIAAQPNDMCGVGVAYGCSIGAVRMLDGDITDSLEANSLGFRQDLVDIYSNSWGPDDDGRTLEAPGSLAQAAFRNGVTKGRNGLGNIFVFASGNGGRYGDNCNCDGYTNSIFTISIGSIDEQNQLPWYSEQCSAQLAVTYSSGNGGSRSIAGTDIHHRCTTSHSGTSAAAPIGAGILALVLQANPTLGWRDVQHIVVRGSLQVNVAGAGFRTNAAGFAYSHSFGFGVLDTTRLVKLATAWVNVGEHHVCASPWMEPNEVCV
jgi:subtilisin family serine protease